MQMSKRLTETDKWKDAWFSELDNDMKLAWLYILDDCNHAGIWQRNLRLLKFHCKSEKSDKEIREIFAGRFHEFGDKWLIAKFLKFQYPNGLGNKKPAIISVMKHLTLHNLLPMVKESLGNDYLYIKDKDKDKSKDKVKNKDKKVKELREGKIDESLELKGMANTEIDELIKFMLAEIKTSRLEGGNKLNRYPCEDVLEICSENFPDQNRVEVVKRIITATAKDKFHSKNMKGFAYLKNNFQKLIHVAKGDETLQERYERQKKYVLGDDTPKEDSTSITRR